jgi:hypothetical protein
MNVKIIMTKAQHGSQAWQALWIHHPTNTGSLTNNDTNVVMSHALPQGSMYIITHHNIAGDGRCVHSACTAKLTGMNSSIQIHPVILSWLGQNWDIKIGTDSMTLDCHIELKVNDVTWYCTHPNY